MEDMELSGCYLGNAYSIAMGQNVNGSELGFGGN